MTEPWQRDPRSVADRLIERGSAYDIAAMETIYDSDQYILFVEDDGSVRRAGRDETLALFRGWRDAGAEPLSKEAEFLHVETGRDHAVALIRRRMKTNEPSRLYELRLRKVGDAWKVSGETVSPWPPEMGHLS